MKKILISMTAFLFILSACAESKSTTKSEEISEFEKDSLEFFGEIAEENDLTLLLDYRTSGAEAKEYNKFIKDAGYYNGEYTSNVIYKMYDEDVDFILDFTISTYKKKPDESYFYGTTCVVGKNAVEYFGYYGFDEEFEDFCYELDGKFYESYYE